MTEKIWILEEIRKIVPEDGELELKEKYVAVRRWATDRAGTYIWKAYQKVGEGYVELDFLKDIDDNASYLAKSITAKKIIKEVLLKVGISDLMDMKERIEKKPKVTAGIQRGSCVYLYIRGKKGMPAQLQLTE